ncbi:hypothetical protein [Knoellia subterranea]|uniref:Uncharacterized protein n=1 Tax=Knoellia subterranea KCTC 19937 TaxID=1385521 RepID=A0A0A0JSB8_9MICO|nr:hypothetical protein [Knoellia subterranea]KGN39589.1 hypothetical protein N803_01830 [Knoellia subterranea KCTC 19937]
MGTINEPSGSTREVAQGTDTHASTTTERRTADRRSLIRNATLAAGGVVAANVALARPAAANDPNDITLSSSKTTAGLTGATTTHVGAGAAFMFQTGNVWSPGSSAYGCAVAGWANLPSKPHGVYGWTGQPGYAVIGYGNASTSTGAMFHGGRANVFLQPSGASPASRSDAHSTGEFIEDSAGNLWVCVGSGSPGRWRKLAGPATAGAYHALTPGRAYDSRLAVPGPQGPIGPGANRTISVAHSRNPSTGAVVTSNFVPAGATAVFINFTIVSTAGGGYLTVNPGGTTSIGASAINWNSTGQVVANGLAVALNASRQLTIVNGSGGRAHFIVDVMGYYL